jgi:hypothetical protein
VGSNRYGIQLHITNIIKKLYDRSTCKVVHEGKLSGTIAINTGVRQMHFVSHLFLMVMDGVLN